MGRKSSLCLLLIAGLLSGSLTGCLFRTRKADHILRTTGLQQATLNDLVTNIQAQAAKINTLNATVDIAPSVENKKKGEVTDFTEVRGYILMRAPEMLRMIGLFPVVRNRVFDMVSDGKTFKVSLPTQNKFIVGTNNAPEKPSPNTLENLRPQVIFDSLLLHAIHPEEEVPVLEQSTETVREEKSKKQVEIPDYIVDVIRHQEQGAVLARRIIFSRVDLKPHRQLIYDNQGQLATEAIYENFADYQGVSFPSQITINRPQEGYSIQLTIVKLTLNEPLKDEQFELQQPPGSKLQVLK